MSNETKREVFDAVWNRLAGYQVFFNGWPRETLDGYKKRYDNALPDDLPMIPKAVGAFIKRQKPVEDNLATLFYDACGFDKERGNGWSMFQDTDKFLWAYDNQNTFARAWVLGVWRVEETGEIVKLEAEK